MKKYKGEKYFSTAYGYFKRERKHLVFKALMSLFRLFVPKVDILGAENLGNEPVVIISNHAREFAPNAFIKAYKRKNRMWSTPNLCFANKVPDHVMFSFFPNVTGFKAKLTRLASYIVAPFIPPIFRSLEVIPAYRNLRAEETFRKSAETLQEGKDVIIFAETEVPDVGYKYVNKLNGGFLRLAHYYYLSTGKELKFVPAYCCKSLRKIVFGSPVSLDPFKPQRAQFHAARYAIMDGIEDAAKTLPPHEITPFGAPIEDEERLNRYADKDRFHYSHQRTR